MPASPARIAAFDILLRVERESSYASELLHSAAYESLSSLDHALTTELVMGVLRWRSRLDDEIATASSQPLPKLDLEILIAVRLALYQFRWLDRIPRHAALHESVELVKRARKTSAAGFVNAVLRRLSATKRSRAIDQADPSTETLAQNFSHPLWMAKRWAEEYGLPTARKICEYDQSIPGTTIRIRSFAAEAELKPGSIVHSNGALLTSARRVDYGHLRSTHAFLRGEIVIQDEGSQLVAALLGRGSRAGTKILDCCAAPGGKTLAIADRNPQASITAVELYPHRARLLQNLLRVAQPQAEIKVLVGDIRHVSLGGSFDLVLADVPCSGTGTIARNPEIKWRLKPDDLVELQARQIAILRSALALTGPGGRVVYSTCSLEREENEDVIEAALADHASFRVVHCLGELERLRDASELVWPEPTTLTRGPYLRTIPGVHPCDGFFAATLERI